MTKNELPKNKWVLLVEENFVGGFDRLYWFYNGQPRHAYDGDLWHIVPEGGELPVWLEISPQALNDLNILDAFKHVYILRTTWERYVADPRAQAGRVRIDDD